MSKLNLTAGVQYNDFVGSIAFDNADKNTLIDFLKQQGEAKAGEFVLGYEVFVHPGSLNDSTDIKVVVHLGNISTEDVRTVEVTVGVLQFLKFFKRINFVAENRGR